MQDILARLHDEIPRSSPDTGEEHRAYRQSIYDAFAANRAEATSGAKPIVKRTKRGYHPHAHGYRHPDR